MKKNKKKRISALRRFGIGKDVTSFLENFSLLIESGMDIPSVIDSIKQETKSRSFKKILDQILEEVENGNALWKSFDAVGFLPEQVITLIKVGEETGRLTENLKIIAEQQRKEEFFRSKVKSAMMYPVLLFFVTMIIAFGIAWFILPRLTQVFRDIDAELPAITKMLVAIGDFLNKNGSVFIPSLIIGMFILTYILFFNKKTRFLGQGILFRIPGIKRLIQDIEISRFGYLFGILVDSGVPIKTAIESLVRGTVFRRYKKFYEHLEKGVDEGKSFKVNFSEYRKTNKLIPPTIQGMIIAGEQSGSLSTTLLRIAKMHEERIDIATKNLTVMMEPILLVIVWIVVVFVALATIMPIYGLVGSISR
ncbi:type II secretion system F family protein [bacterium]|nr:type II secretion system F family protein [bacterium]